MKETEKLQQDLEELERSINGKLCSSVGFEENFKMIIIALFIVQKYGHCEISVTTEGFTSEFNSFAYKLFFTVSAVQVF